MSDYIDLALKQFAPEYERAITNFNKRGYERLAQLREALDPHNKNFNMKLSQRDLSRLAKILPQNYNKIEKGRENGGNNITLEQAIKLSIIYGCSIDYLAYGKESPTESDSDKIIKDLRKQLDSERRLNELLTKELEEFKK